MIKWLYKLWYMNNPVCIHCNSAMKENPNNIWADYDLRL